MKQIIELLKAIIDALKNKQNNELTDAPKDGKKYVRQNGAWVELLEE